MKVIIVKLINALVSISFLAGGIFLLMNNHPIAGGWIIVFAILSTPVSFHDDIIKEIEKKEE
jgi:hypothetical protein